MHKYNYKNTNHIPLQPIQHFSRQIWLLSFFNAINSIHFAIFYCKCIELSFFLNQIWLVFTLATLIDTHTHMHMYIQVQNIHTYIQRLTSWPCMHLVCRQLLCDFWLILAKNKSRNTKQIFKQFYEQIQTKSTGRNRVMQGQIRRRESGGERESTTLCSLFTQHNICVW